MEGKAPEIAYRYWQDRFTPFYLAARILYKNNSTREASLFCGFQAIENLLKGALDFYKETFNWGKEGHDLQKLVCKLKRRGIDLKIQEYFSNFQDVPRYPQSKRNKIFRGSGLHVPPSFMDDLDEIVYKLISQIPDRGVTRLWHLLNDDTKATSELAKDNKRFWLLRNLYFSKF